jgi:hypothetical protein
MEYESDLSELLDLILFAGLLFFVIIVMLANYAKSINRLMGLHKIAKVPKNWIKKRTHIFQRQVSSCNKSIQIENPTSLRQAYSNRKLKIIRATWIAYGVFVVCGFITILILDDAVNTWSDLINPSFIEEHFFYWAEVFISSFLSLCILSLGPAIINIYPHVPMRFLLIGSMTLGLLGVLVDAYDAIEIFEGTLEILFTCFLILFRLTRQISIPFIVIFTIFGVGSGLIDLEAALNWDSNNNEIVDTQSEINNFAMSMILVVAVVPISILIVKVLVWFYEKGYMSDTSTLALLSVTFIASTIISDGSDTASGVVTPSVIAMIGITWVGVTVASYVYALTLTPSIIYPPRALLVLRIFSRNRESEYLLDAMQNQWRFAGPVFQIGGPDLAKINADPYEIMKFFTFRIHDLFIFENLSRDDLLKTLDLSPDREGRFRINEIFCINDTWQSSVEHLIDSSNVILLDIRGFHLERAGVAYEMKLLAQNSRLARVVAVGDDKTDWEYVDKLFEVSHQNGICETRLNINSTEIEKICMKHLIQTAENYNVSVQKINSIQ